MNIPDSFKEIAKREGKKMLSKAFKTLVHLVIWKGLERTASHFYEKIHETAKEHELEEEAEIDFRSIDNF